MSLPYAAIVHKCEEPANIVHIVEEAYQNTICPTIDKHVLVLGAANKHAALYKKP